MNWPQITKLTINEAWRQEAGGAGGRGQGAEGKEGEVRLPERRKDSELNSVDRRVLAKQKRRRNEPLERKKLVARPRTLKEQDKVLGRVQSL